MGTDCAGIGGGFNRVLDFAEGDDALECDALEFAGEICDDFLVGRAGCIWQGLEGGGRCRGLGRGLDGVSGCNMGSPFFAIETFEGVDSGWGSVKGRDFGVQIDLGRFFGVHLFIRRQLDCERRGRRLRDERWG